MNLLLDTCTFLWFITRASDLSGELVTTIRNPQNEIFLSVVSVWEIATKEKLGKIKLPEEAGNYVPKQRTRHKIASLALDEASTVHLGKLPALHRDPFDRMLICQALEHGLAIVTPDTAITAYPVKTVWE